MKKYIFLIICFLISLSINSQELPLLNSSLDLSEFCGSEYNADGYQIRLCMPFSLFVPEGTRLISNETWDTRITNRENEDDRKRNFSINISEETPPPYREWKSKEMLIKEYKKSWEEGGSLNSDFRGFTHEDENGFIVRTKFWGAVWNEDGSMKQFEYHFYFVADNGKVSFSFENERGYVYSEAEISLMYESLKTIKWY
tara:strand:- start:52 stop:648 length:597 start_codon:yes stop_codon:yes gene_type:complete